MKSKYCLFEEDYLKKKKCSKKYCQDYDTCSRKDKAEEYLSSLEATENYLKETNRHDPGELQIMQGYSLETKIRLTRERIEAWYDYWGGNVYVSFSGGKDSTVMLDLVRNVCGLKDVPAVFIDTGLEYPEIREFVKGFENVTWIKPKKNFKQVVLEDGYPFISKEVSNCVAGAKRFLNKYLAEHPEYEGHIDDIPTGLNFRLDRIRGVLKGVNEGDKSIFNHERYRFLLDSDFLISERCCNVMKKAPAHDFGRETGLKPILATMCSESRIRTVRWLKSGCNAFYSDYPKSQPMSFWTEQDVLLYIKQRNIPICSVYGDIVEDLSNEEVNGQLTFSDIAGWENLELFDAKRPPLKTTGCERTGCMFCGYGCHLDNPGEGRFETMKETHPKQYEYIMKPVEDGGLGYKNVIDWINKHGNLNIKY